MWEPTRSKSLPNSIRDENEGEKFLHKVIVKVLCDGLPR